MAAHGARVLRGPFAGLGLPIEELESVDAAAAKLVGAYEQEIADLFVEQFPVFVDIGCADGYYAVGVAVAHSATVVHAYDLARSARVLTARAAASNDVRHRVRIHRRFDRSAAHRIDLRGALVLCDVEGAERSLFTPPLVAAMRSSTVVVELHEAAHPDVLAHLRHCFGGGHEVEVREQRPRRREDHAALRVLTSELAGVALDELRSEPARWAIFRPRRD